MPHARAEETNVADMHMEIYIASQKQSRGYNRGDHAGTMRGDSPSHNQVAANEQQNCADAVQTRNQGREERVFFSDHAAGLVVRRLAIRNASPNITSENRSNVAIAEGRGKVASIPG